jgi:hypothetical protein
MFEDFGPRPDDTVELATVPPHRSVALIVAAAIITVAVLVAAGFLLFGGFGGGADAGGSASPGLLPAVSPSTDAATTAPSPSSTAPSPAPSATPVVAKTPTTPATTRPSTPPAASGVSIIAAGMTPPSYQGADCPGATTASATVVVTAPVTITYHWVSAPGTGVTDQAYRFAAAGSHVFTHAYKGITIPDGQFTVAFVIRTPTAHQATMSYHQTCGARASAIAVKITHPTLGKCTIAFTSTLTAGVGPMTVTSEWQISAPLAGQTGRTWIVPPGGGSNPRTATVVGIAKGASVTAQLTVDSPVRSHTPPVTATCR